VSGGGNTAVGRRCFLNDFASKVTCGNRRDSLRAEKIMQGPPIQEPQDWKGDLGSRRRRVLGSEDPRGVEAVPLEAI